MQHAHRGGSSLTDMENINTRAYWESRFASGSWERNQGRLQTADFARGQIPHLNIPPDFAGTILDFGCGLGDAMPIYRQHYPQARLLGMDISASAIDLCREHYGQIATFSQGDHTIAPPADIVISSNVFEHLSDDRHVARVLLNSCTWLKIIVPYKEYPPSYKAPADSEHVNTHYDENAFQELGEYEWAVFPCRGWSEYGFKLWYHVNVLNVFRSIFGRPPRLRKTQIMYHLRGTGR